MFIVVWKTKQYTLIPVNFNSGSSWQSHPCNATSDPMTMHKNAFTEQAAFRSIR